MTLLVGGSSRAAFDHQADDDAHDSWILFKAQLDQLGWELIGEFAAIEAESSEFLFELFKKEKQLESDFKKIKNLNEERIYWKGQADHLQGSGIIHRP